MSDLGLGKNAIGRVRKPSISIGPGSVGKMGLLQRIRRARATRFDRECLVCGKLTRHPNQFCCAEHCAQFRATQYTVTKPKHFAPMNREQRTAWKKEHLSGHHAWFWYVAGITTKTLDVLDDENTLCRVETFEMLIPHYRDKKYKNPKNLNADILLDIQGLMEQKKAA